MARTKHFARKKIARVSITPNLRKGMLLKICRFRGGGKVKKQIRRGTSALREICHFQNTWKLLIPAAPFHPNCIISLLSFAFSSSCLKLA
ncbi:hypothetical protein Nepgr_023576 [Nepenthes gracilis]|uniref:Uncharacterized protein n=1 Tax=Nepenthes gracilis TaxID=150966 RepID=A0AAD3XZ67_NEPGR|nr:hypothetical protein Nepgr_023576 [Nepenthes gracilis]